MPDDFISYIDVCYADIIYLFLYSNTILPGSMLCAFVLAVRRVRPSVCPVICVCAALELVWVLDVFAACIPVLI